MEEEIITDYEFTLADRVGVIQNAQKKYDLENKAYLSFSGGKDSVVCHYLLDKALPGNRIPRVFLDTGIEYKAILDFVKEMADKDDRFVMVRPTRAIKAVLEEYGYPFESKEHSLKMSMLQNGSTSKYALKYKDVGGKFACPKKLAYQFEPDFKLKISDKCCYKLKKEPASKWANENKRPIAITGMKAGEGGQKGNIKSCITYDDGKVAHFHPLLVVSDEWESEFIEKNQIRLCALYYPPYNFRRTGCKGCPFAIELQKELDTMAELLPAERRQCEIIWKPVYDEYRRIGYRLNKQPSLFDIKGGNNGKAHN